MNDRVLPLLRDPASYPAVRRLSALPLPLRPLSAAVLGLAVGGLTSFGQTYLPEWISSFANSSSGWTLVTVLVVALLRANAAWSALAATLCFTGLTLGYQIVSTMRGYPTSEVFFLVVGLVVGPFVGIATAWLRRSSWRLVAATALLAGIGIGEGVYGLTVVSSSTSAVYWVLIAALAILLLGTVVAGGAIRWWQRVAVVVGALLFAAAFLTAYIGTAHLPIVATL